MASSGVVFNPGAIQPRKQRKFIEAQQQFTGTNISQHTGTRDTGLEWIEFRRYLAELLATPAHGSCSHVLDRTKQDRLTKELRKVYRKRIKRAGRRAPPAAAAAADEHTAYERQLTAAATFSTSLNKDAEAIHKLNAEAAVAISLIRECVNATVELVLDQAITSHTDNGKDL